MINLIYSLPSFILFVLMGLTLVACAITATLLIHRFIPVEFRYQQNEAIVCTSAVIGIIYAILVGFTVLYELDTFNKADRAEKDEAKLMFTIYRKVLELPSPGKENVRQLLVDYTKNVINNEWPNMARGIASDKQGTLIVINIFKQLHSFKNLTPLQEIVLNNISIDTNALFDDHQERIASAHTSLVPNIWFVLLLGTFLTIAINLLLGMEVRLHITCMTAIALMLAGVLYLITALDRPYRGDFSVKPITFESTLEYMSWHSMLTKDGSE